MTQGGGLRVAKCIGRGGGIQAKCVWESGGTQAKFVGRYRKEWGAGEPPLLDQDRRELLPTGTAKKIRNSLTLWNILCQCQLLNRQGYLIGKSTQFGEGGVITNRNQTLVDGQVSERAGIKMT